MKAECRDESRTPNFYKKGIILGYKRSLRNQNPSYTRIQILENLKKKEKHSLIGKRIFYIVKKGHSIYKTKWGRIISPHGNSGKFIAKFRKNVAPSLFCSAVFIELH
ncbi:60S ribosomal protein L35A (nucleomorph) [Cryptomonas paramecium]|uniref:60S ribosomal protein L35A n=1 Tax=Cryptomonas paramaecium TaxID=2898 RepID=F2HI67_9CRYP|nr:60S ribosomal protein L35A [Cryptomonas paramecium]AEA38991.1 60S ribosomal protein L35A [Cryptomonas paramecium]|mmetsp:Transcript_5583/g.17819  ORF Transcript_5583/g.17819 Transcript_5583/m.17819 type:complete len:107 (+) Transcript_5583:143-463(+)